MHGFAGLPAPIAPSPSLFAVDARSDGRATRAYSRYEGMEQQAREHERRWVLASLPERVAGCGI